MSKFVKWLTDGVKELIVSHVTTWGIILSVALVFQGVKFLSKSADNGNVLAQIFTFIFAIIIIIWILFAFAYIIIRFIINPIKFCKTRKKLLAEVYEVEKTFVGTSLIYYIKCKFVDSDGNEQIWNTQVNRSIYNSLAPKKQKAFVMFSKSNYDKIDKICPPVYVPIYFGKKGKILKIKVLKGKFENEMEYNWQINRKEV